MRPADLSIFNAERAARRPVALVTDIGDGSQRVVTGAGLAADPLAAEITERFRSGKSGIVIVEGREVFVTVQVPSIRLVIVGAVHIAQALAVMAKLVELELTIIDPRSAFATADRFPDTRLIAEWPADAQSDLRFDSFTAVCLLSHDPKIDDPALAAALRARCFYIGALGSRKTQGRRLDRMRAEGFADEDLDRIHGPIGLDIGSVSPAEIAVAILGEIIAARRRKPLRSERARDAA